LKFKSLVFSKDKKEKEAKSKNNSISQKSSNFSSNKKLQNVNNMSSSKKKVSFVENTENKNRV
jgi:hypothetical protein